VHVCSMYALFWRSRRRNAELHKYLLRKPEVVAHGK
jgi:hypothetical protein